MKIDGDWIRKYRKLNNISQNEMARILETQRCSVSNWERGEHKISKLSAYKIKIKLGVVI